MQLGANFSSGSGNTSVTQIETRASNDFWAALEANLVSILAESGTGARGCGGETSHRQGDGQGGALRGR